MSAVLRLCAALQVASLSAPATASPVLERVDPEPVDLGRVDLERVDLERVDDAQAAGANRMQMRACAERWPVPVLQQAFRDRAIGYCHHGAHVGEFTVDAPPLAGTAQQPGCRVVRVSAEITSRRHRP